MEKHEKIRSLLAMIFKDGVDDPCDISSGLYVPAIFPGFFGSILFNITDNVLKRLYGEDWSTETDLALISEQLSKKPVKKHLSKLKQGFLNKSQCETFPHLDELNAIRMSVLNGQRTMTESAAELATLFIVPAVAQRMIQSGLRISMFQPYLPTTEFLTQFCPDLTEPELKIWYQTLMHREDDSSLNICDVNFDIFSGTILSPGTDRSWKPGPPVLFPREYAADILAGSQPDWVHEKMSLWRLPRAEQLDDLKSVLNALEGGYYPIDWSISRFWVLKDGNLEGYDILKGQRITSEEGKFGIILSGYNSVLISTIPDKVSMIIHRKTMEHFTSGLTLVGERMESPAEYDLITGSFEIGLSKDGYRTTKRKLDYSLDNYINELEFKLTGESFVFEENDFSIGEISNVITDGNTGKEWLVGPDRDTSSSEAMEWVEDLSDDWRLPTVKELDGLYRSGISASSWSFFKNSGWWVWTSQIEYDNWDEVDLSINYSFLYGVARKTSFTCKEGHRAFAVLGTKEE